MKRDAIDQLHIKVDIRDRNSSPSSHDWWRADGDDVGIKLTGRDPQC